MPAPIRLLLPIALALPVALAAEDWPQFKGDARHSGNAPDRSISTPLALAGAVPLGDAILTSPVIAGHRVFVVDASGVAYCIDANSFEVLWRFASPGGAGNTNNVSSPAIAGRFLHFGTMAGRYYVLERTSGKLVREIDCRDPIFSTPVVGAGRVYFATLGSQVHAVEFDGSPAWSWDFVKEIIGFHGNRWSGEEWHAFKKGRVNWKDHFCSSRNIALFEKTVVVPCGGRTVFLEDAGTRPRVRAVAEIPSYAGREYPATFGQSIGESGEVYVQWHRRDNAGRTEILRIDDEDRVTTAVVPGTETAIHLHGLLSFASVSVRGDAVYRVRPEQGFGLARHDAKGAPRVLSAAGSVSPPILLAGHAVYGGLDGSLRVVPLSGEGKPWSFATPFGRPITAPAAVADGRVWFGGEDGYLYALASADVKPAIAAVSPPTRDLELWRIRSPLKGRLAAPEFDWNTNYGNMACTNSNEQGIEPPVKIKWIRRVEGTVKHLPVCGGGRMYTHTAEGQIIAVEQETGRLLWRRYWPDVYLSFTSPLYLDGRLLVPQAGMVTSRMRCLDAASGKLLWEQPFTGSPSWSRQFPPVVNEGIAIYASGSGRYAAQGSEKPFTFKGTPKRAADGSEVMSFIYTHDNPYYPKDNRPLIWGWKLDTGELAWTKDFSEYGSGGNDCGIALMDGKLYYSTFFGYQASKRRRRGLPEGVNGLTACIDPRSGDVLWRTTDYFVTAGCTITAKDGRLYLGGYNVRKESDTDRHIWCLDASDGSLVWRSDPVRSAVNVVTVGEDFIFSNAIRAECHIFDKKTGKIAYHFDLDYNCTRFTLSGRYLMGANMDMLELRESGPHRLVATGPAVDSRECLGSSVSNGRIFYTSQASGLQISALTGAEAKALKPAWER